MTDAPARAVLILGGTAEARTLAERLYERQGLRVITSLAGRTARPASPPGELRIGGFGGPDGLATYLKDEGIDAVMDATHPFATTISVNAVEACRQASVPCVRYDRPAWQPEIGDNWTNVKDEGDAAAAIPASARVFLALGSQYLAAFETRDDVSFVVRMVDAPASPAGGNWIAVTGKPSASVGDESALLGTHAITHVVCRNSGGDAGYAKIAAARALRLPVIMIERPEPAGGKTFATIDGVIDWLEAVIG